jgi:hypothetical protein
MNKQNKFLMVLAIAVSLVMAPAAMAAEEKPGADVVIIKKDGTQVVGELICVKKEFVTVMEAGNGVNVDLKEISVIEVKPKSKGGKAATGLLIGLISGSIVGYVASGGLSRLSGNSGGFIDLRGAGAIIGAPLVGIIGLMAGIDAASGKTYKLGGAPTNINKEILSKLDKQARFPSTEAERLALLGMK